MRAMNAKVAMITVLGKSCDRQPKTFQTLMLTTFFVLMFAGQCFVSRAAWGAQDVTVIKDNSPVREEPKEKGRIVDYLQAGDEVRISNFPVNAEFYKVRARNGQYGWIQLKYLDLKIPEEKADDPNAIPEPQADRHFAIRALGGFNFFRPSDLNDLFGFDELNYGYNAGAEFIWNYHDRWSAILRGEVILKDTVARETTTNTVYALAFRSYPLMAGLDFKILKELPVYLSVTAYAGIALRTTFSAQAINFSEPNTATLAMSHFTGMGLVHVTRPLGRLFSVGLSGGYRYLKTSKLDPENTANGGTVFRVAGIWQPREIDLSGFLLNFNFSVHF